MPLMDEFKEERESIKNASWPKKWQYFKDYYLKWVIVGIAALIFLIAMLVSMLTNKEEMLVELVNFNEDFSAEDELEIPFEEQYLENTKKQTITLDYGCTIVGKGKDQNNSQLVYSYQDEQKIAAIAIAGDLDLMISGKSVIERFADEGMYIALDQVLSPSEYEGRELIYSDGKAVAVCMDDSVLLNRYYIYKEEPKESIYAAFVVNSKRRDMAVKFYRYIK